MCEKLDELSRRLDWVMQPRVIDVWISDWSKCKSLPMFMMRRRSLSDLSNELNLAYYHYKKRWIEEFSFGNEESYRKHKRWLWNEQDGICPSCVIKQNKRPKWRRRLLSELRTRYPPQEMQVDHAQAKKLGGSDELHNLQLLCIDCNNDKGDKPIRDWLLSIIKNC